MKTTIDEIIEQAVIDLDRTSIVPAGYAEGLRKGIDNIITLAKANSFEELSSKQRSDVKRFIENSNRAVRINDPFFALHTNVVTKQVTRRITLAAITPTLGALATLGVLAYFENR